jgi:hypothetical protein
VHLDFRATPASRRCDANTLNREQCIRASSIHEFGHALGLEHEQSRPTAPDECSITAEFRWALGDTTFGDFDMDSIMNYCRFRTTPSQWDYAGLVDFHGPELGIPLKQRTSNLCIHAASGGAYPTEGTRAVLQTGCSTGMDWAVEIDQYGWIRHSPTGLTLLPENFAIANGTRLVWTAYVGLEGLFRVTPGGSLQHVISGQCVHPNGGSATPASGTELVLWSGCDEPRLQYTGVMPSAGARIAHISGLCLHPEGGSANPANDTRAVLWNDCTSMTRIQYKLLPSGSIQHVSSGKCLHPYGGSSNPANGTKLVFWTGCDEPRLAFELTARGSLRHVSSGKCLHTDGGALEPAPGTGVVLWDGCDEDRLRFAPVTF